MFTTKSLHIALLGVIIGAAAAYVYASYQTESGRQAAVQAIVAASGATNGQHPDVTPEQVLDMFQQALAANPDDPELMERYARFLYDLGRYAEAADWLGRVLALRPDAAELQVARATALYGAGQVDAAIAEYERIVAADAGNALALHNLIVAYLDARTDVARAEAALEQLQRADPAYPAIPSLRARLDAARAAAPR